MIMTKEVLSLKEAAEYLNFSETTMYRFLKEKKIPGCKVGGVWRFYIKRLEELFKK